MADWEDTAVPLERSGGSNGQHRTGHGHVTETVQLGSLTATPASKSGAERETITISPRATIAGRVLSDRAKEMLANIEAHDTVDAPETTEPPPAAAEPTAAPAPPVDPPVVASPAAAAAAPAPDQSADLTAARDRALEHNARLVAEVETLRKRPSRGEPAPREKALDEIEKMYAEDPVGANRRLAALALGHEDAAHADVDRQLSWLYHDLTERELKVPLDQSVKAQREAERTRVMMARDKRERAIETAPAPAADDTETKRTEHHTQIVANRLAAVAAEHPLLMSLAQDFHGQKPEAVVLADIYRGFQTGEYNPAADNDKLIEASTKKIEAQYQVLADKILKARPLPSTAAPQAPAATEKSASPTGNGTRTITAASASVAPATLPVATKSETTTEKPKYKNEAERRKAIAARLFPDAT